LADDGVRQHPDWTERLFYFIEQRRREPFVWGRNDCCLFAADAVLAVCGVDIARRWRDAYHSSEEAHLILKKKHGGPGGIAEAMELAALEHGFVEVPASNARRGDVVLIDTPSGKALSICIGDKLAAMGQEGIVFPPLREGLRAWRTA